MHKPRLALLLLTVLTAAVMAVQAQSAKPAPLNSTAIEWNSVEAKTNATGSSRKFFEGSTAGLDLLECHASTLNPGTTNHVILERPNDELTIVQAGTLEAIVNGQWVRLGPGSVVYNAANTQQSLRNLGAVPATYHVIKIHPTAAPKPAAGK